MEKAQKLGAAISFQSASVSPLRSLPGNQHRGGRWQPGKRAPNPLVHRTLLRGSNFMVPQSGHVTRCHSLSFWPEGHCRIPGSSDGRAAQPGHSWSGGFQARASCSPWGKETKLRRATGSGCSRDCAKHKDGRSPMRSPRKGRGGGVTHWSLEPSGWRWKQGPLQLQKGRKRPGISGCREPETAESHGVSLVSMGGKSTHQTPPSGSFCSIIHTAFGFGDSCKGEAQGPRLENQGSLPHMPPWSPKLGAEPLPPLWGTTDGLSATPSARRGSLRARTQWEPTVRPRPGHDPEAGTHPAMRGVKHYCLRPISRDTPGQTKPKDPTGNKVKQNKSNSTASQTWHIYTKNGRFVSVVITNRNARGNFLDTSAVV